MQCEPLKDRAMAMCKYHKLVVENTIRSVIDEMPDKRALENYLLDLSIASRECGRSKYIVEAYKRYAGYVHDMTLDSFMMSLDRGDFL